jgi:hypothetical protein
MSSAGRNNTIDFWRGFVLVVILVNHIPGNLLEHLTPRNYGFSDAAEAFIFISGLSLALVYFPKIPQGDVWGVFKRCLRRSFELYRMHLLLTAVAIALFSLGYELSDDIGLIEADGRSAVFGDTAKGITGIVFLGHQLGYFNILPLYIALMLWAPVALVLARVHVGLALAVSVVIYVLARVGLLVLPSWPEPGTWFFNPFAWQLLFTIGIVCGVVWRGKKPPFSLGGFLVASLFLVGSLLVMTDAFGTAPALFDKLFAEVDISKNDLGLGRLIHFLALAYVVVQSKLDIQLAKTRMGPEVIRLGRYSLPIFAAGSLLAAGGQVIMTLAAVKSSASPHVIGMIFTIAAVMVLLALARYLEWTTLKPAVPLKGEPAKPLDLPSVSTGR